MTRRKVKLAFIMNDSSRKVTFRKRKRGFMKKMFEINKLCDVPTCAVIYSPDEPQPDVWPNPSEARRLIEQFENMPEEERNKKMVTHEMFLKQMVEKEQQKVNKQKKENREVEIWLAMNQCLTGKPLTVLEFIDIQEIGWMIDGRLKEVVAIQSRKEDELAKMNQPLGAQPSVTSATIDENIQNAIQVVPWSIGDVPTPQSGDMDD
ncbi:hypothetical protein ACFX13_033943 [Malus domestica]|nr:agamous-like MADS-box protein AGL80 [Malus domestica]